MQNLLNQKFGKLLIIEKTNERRRKYIVWKCLCDCNNECLAITSDLILGRVKSCGCLLIEFNHSKLLDNGEYGLNQTYRKYVSSAKSRLISFDLSKEDFKIISQNNCWYCGKPPMNISQPNTIDKTSDIAFTNGIFVYNGLDRVDNSLGYTKENVVACCEDCNRAKLTLDQFNFIELANRIAKLHPIETFTDFTKSKSTRVRRSKINS